MKTCKVLLLGYGVAGKAFARILNKTHDDILKEKGIDVKVVGITTGSRGSLVYQGGLDLAEATRQLEEEGRFDPKGPHYSKVDSLTAAEMLDYDVLMELTPLNIFTGQPATDHIKAALERGKHAACRYHFQVFELPRGVLHSLPERGTERNFFCFSH